MQANMTEVASTQAGPSRLPMVSTSSRRQQRRSPMMSRRLRLRQLAASTAMLALAAGSASANATPFMQKVLALNEERLSNVAPSATLYARQEATAEATATSDSSSGSSSGGVPVQLLIAIGALVATAVVLATITCYCRYRRRGWTFRGKRLKFQRRSSWNVESLPNTLPYRMTTGSSSTLDEKSFHGFYNGGHGGAAPIGHHQSQYYPEQQQQQQPYPGQDMRQGLAYATYEGDDDSYKGAFSREISRLSATTMSSYGHLDHEKQHFEQRPRSMLASSDDASRKSSKSGKGACTPPPARRPSFLERALARPMSGQSSQTGSGAGQRIFSNGSSMPQPMPWMANDMNAPTQHVALPSPVIVQEQMQPPEQVVRNVAQPGQPQAEPHREVRRTPSGTILSALGAPLHAWRRASQNSSSQPRHASSNGRSFSRRAWNSFHQPGPSPRLFSIESDFEGTIGGHDGELPMARPAQGRRPLCEDSVIASPVPVFPRVASTPQLPPAHSSADLYADLMSGAYRDAPIDARMPTNVAGLGASYRSVSDSTPRCARRDPQSGYLLRSHTRNRSISAQHRLDERVLEELKRRQAREDGNESSQDRRTKRTAKITSWVTANEMCHAGSPPSVLSRNDSISSIALTTSEFISVSRQASLVHRNMMRRLQMLPKPMMLPEDAQVGQAFAPEALHKALQRQQDMRMMESPLQPPPRISSFQDAPASFSGICEEHAGTRALTACDEAGESRFHGDEAAPGASVAAAMSHATITPDKSASQATVTPAEPISAKDVRAPRDVWLAEHAHSENDKRRLILEQRRRSQLALATPESQGNDGRENLRPSTAITMEPEAGSAAMHTPKMGDDKRNSAMQDLLRHMSLGEAQTGQAQLRRKSTLMAILRSDSMNRSLTQFKAPVLSQGSGRDLIQAAEAPSSLDRKNSSSMRCVSTPATGFGTQAGANVASAVQGQTPNPRVQAMLERARRASASALTLPAGVRLEHLKELAAAEEAERDNDNGEDLPYIAPKSLTEAKNTIAASQDRRGSASTSSDHSAPSSQSSGHVSGPRPMPTSQPRMRAASAREQGVMAHGPGRGSQSSADTFCYSNVLY